MRSAIFEKGYILFILLIFTNPVYGRPLRAKNSTGTITGKVLDKATGSPIEFANIILLNEGNGKQITGAMTDKAGDFTLTGIKTGAYYLHIQFIGYVTKTIPSIVLSKFNSGLNLGRIYLKSSAINLPTVVSEGKRSPITYQLDKQVIDVNQIKTALSGTAADVLEYVPSVSVDINGNVSLRGSTNFQVLIDGRPSIMNAQDALQQIPASSIQNIEIMTNPSAKYDASGTAGIINIILKKNSDFGLSGIVNSTGGLDDKYGGNFLLQYRTHFMTYDFGADFNRRTFPGTNRQEKEFIIGSNISYLNSDGNVLWQRILSGVRGGIGFNLSQNDNLLFGGRYGGRAFHHYSTLSTKQSSDAQPQQINYIDSHNYNHYGTYYQLNANYIHTFGPDGNQLTGYLSYGHNNSNNAGISTATQSRTTLNGTQTTELGPQGQLRGNIDYTLPVNESEKFSAGSEFFSRTYQDMNKLYIFNSTTGLYDFQVPFSHTNDFNRTRFAAYSMFSDKWDSLQVQVGFRTEYTYQLVAQADTSQRFAFSRWDYFPSISSSYNLGGGTQLMASYTRRIERPNGGDLEPYYSWFDANTVHIGNPSLRPELIDSYEMGLETFFGKAYFSNDLYYRFTQDKIEDINSVYAENVTLTSVANVGNDYSLGYEFSILLNPIKMWQLDFMGSVYDYKISGAVSNESFARQSFDWSIKCNNTFTLTHSTEVQLDARYHSPSVTAQGTWGGFFTTDLALKQDLIAKTLSLTLQANDLLSTGRREFTSQGVGFYDYNYYYRRAPIVMLDIQYNFNNYKSQNERGNS
ncbi:MAG: TonB-dependent receptor family protein [Bacteroidetes bacterium]|nr:TonB-dependent receptor family protein [Bacteroidota bacterium]